MKICFKCGLEKPLSLFYKHKMMADGHLNKCIDCTRKDVKQRFDVLTATDPEFVESEKFRARDKYRRLYKGTKTSPLVREKSNENYLNRYPEKYAAKNQSVNIECPEGFHKHHWSYKEEHYKDIMIIPADLHYKIHRYMNYDQKEMKYRTSEGVLLETRELHELFIEIVKQIF